MSSEKRNDKLLSTRRISSLYKPEYIKSETSPGLRVSPSRPEIHEDVVDSAPQLVFTWWDVLVTLFSIASYCVDVGTDVSLAIIYFQRSQYTYFSWTVVFIVLPSIIISVFSLRWYILDHQARISVTATSNVDVLDARFHPVPWWKWIVRSLCIIFQVAPILRYADSLWYGWKSRRIKDEEEFEQRQFFYDLMLFEDADSTLLRLLEAFMEAAPQLILQLYIMVNYGVDGEKENNYFLVTFQTGSVCMSLVSLAWALVSYHKSLRYSRHNKKNMTYKGIVLCFCWRICMLLPRVLAFALFASLYKIALLAVAGFHWAAMSFWIIIESYQIRPGETNFCKSRMEQVIFDIIIGIVWVFCCFNIREGHTRLRYIIYYSIAYIENVTLVIIWYSFTDKKDTWYHLPALVVVPTVFFLGLFFMLLYYWFAHPETDGVYLCLSCSYWKCKECQCEKCLPVTGGAYINEMNGGTGDGSGNARQMISSV